MKTLIHARSAEALKNGSFVAQRVGKKWSTFAHYMNGDLVDCTSYLNGDFNSWVAALPPPLAHARLTWSLRDARKIMPRGI